LAINDLRREAQNGCPVLFFKNRPFVKEQRCQTLEQNTDCVIGVKRRCSLDGQISGELDPGRAIEESFCAGTFKANGIAEWDQ
jgi:hypothetical protein